MVKEVDPVYMRLLDNNALISDEDFTLLFVDGIVQSLAELKLNVDATITKVLLTEFTVLISKCISNFWLVCLKFP